MESFELLSGAKAIIDYAHTPDAYQKVLETINKKVFGLNNIYVVFGAGGERDKLKRPQMAQISEKFATHTFVVPDNPRKENPKTISKDIIAGFNCNN
jgi:UDP-N-acetylmuramoyl-L-alanyl-D-glutamate--2,6-diaminopimelate ligase